MSIPDSNYFPAHMVTSIYNELEQSGITIWIDGGWSVDALLETQSRPHSDLDIAISQDDVGAFRELMTSKKYEQTKLDSKWNFILEDKLGYKIDIHVFVRDSLGNIIDGILYPEGSLSGIGIINGHQVRCIAPTHMVQFLTPFVAERPEYLHAIKELSKKFNLLL